MATIISSIISPNHTEQPQNPLLEQTQFEGTSDPRNTPIACFLMATFTLSGIAKPKDKYGRFNAEAIARSLYPEPTYDFESYLHTGRMPSGMVQPPPLDWRLEPGNNLQSIIYKINDALESVGKAEPTLPLPRPIHFIPGTIKWGENPKVVTNALINTMLTYNAFPIVPIPFGKEICPILITGIEGASFIYQNPLMADGQTEPTQHQLNARLPIDEFPIIPKELYSGPITMYKGYPISLVSNQSLG